ncbi:hypothetical protein Trydic_g11187 [Trypoxylus dichotomus]
MKPIIDIDDCLRDSPKFRTLLQEEEANINELEQKLEKIIKLCGNVVDSGKTYVAQQSLFANGLWDLTGHFKDDNPVVLSLRKLIHNFQEMNKFHTILLDQASRTIIKNLTSFCKNDVKRVKENKYHFEKISQDLDVALVRNSQTPKTKPQEVEENANLLVATRSCFGHQVLDYVHCITILQNKKRYEILSPLLSYMHACTTYYHQGSDLCEDLEPFLKSLAEEIREMQEDTVKLEKDLENNYKIVDNKEIIPPVTSGGNEPILEGYLFKRTSNAFKTWNRRWFCLRDNQLVYRKRTGEEESTMEEDLRLCTVKPVVDGDRRFCFEIVSPSKNHILQADSKDMVDTWIAAVQKGIGIALQRYHSGNYTNINSSGHEKSSSSSDTSLSRKSKLVDALLRIPGNDACCDCGVHRSLGVHYSKVRSLTLDDWEPECLKVMAELGNSIVNGVYEANVTSDIRRATANCTINVREGYIKSKYVERKFVKKLPDITAETSSKTSLMEIRKWSVRRLRRRPRNSNSLKSNKNNEQANKNSVLMFGNDLDKPIDQILDLSSDQDSTGGEDNDILDEEDISKLHPEALLYKAAAAHNIPVMCEALALGADKQWINSDDRNRCALHQAILSGSVMACAYLLLNGARINVQDDDGKTPLHLATHEGHTAQVCLLLKHRADQHLPDSEGLLPLKIAEEKEHADIVTLLRLGKLNEEMKESDSGVSGDDTFNDVVRDFSQLACTHPERLNRIKNK